MLLKPLAVDTPRAGFNGGEVLGPDDARLSELVIDAAAVRAAVDHLTANGVDSWVFADGKWYLTNPHAHYIPREQLSVSLDPTLVPDLAPYYGRVHKLMATTEDFDLMARMESEVAALLAGRATVLRSQQYYLDVTHPQANKGYAAQQLAKLLGIADAEMCCLGDMPNDVPMFRVAGMSVSHEQRRRNRCRAMAQYMSPATPRAPAGPTRSTATCCRARSCRSRARTDA